MTERTDRLPIPSRGTRGAWSSPGFTHPAWFINLAKQPEKVWLEVGNRKLRARPQELHGAEREAAYAKVAAVAPRYAKYPKSTDREIPVIRLTPA